MSANAMPSRIDRLALLGTVGGAFYLFLGIAALYFVGRFMRQASPGQLWMTVVGLGGGAFAFMAGGWLVRSSLADVEARRTRRFRHLASGAFAAIVWAPYELLVDSPGFFPWILASLAFLGTETVIARWATDASAT